MYMFISNQVAFPQQLVHLEAFCILLLLCFLCVLLCFPQLHHGGFNLFCTLPFLYIYLTGAAVIAGVTLQAKWQAGSSEIALPLCKQLVGEHKGTVHSIDLFPESQNIFSLIAPFPAGLRTGSPRAAPITMLAVQQTYLLDY